MKYTFANYPTGKHTVSIGSDILVICDGIAEVNELDPAQVALAEVYGGKPITSTLNATEIASTSTEQKTYLFLDTLSRKGRSLTNAIRNLNTQIKSVTQGNSPK